MSAARVRYTASPTIGSYGWSVFDRHHDGLLDVSGGFMRRDEARALAAALNREVAAGREIPADLTARKIVAEVRKGVRSYA